MGLEYVQVSGGVARYWTASSDGRYAFYTEGEGRKSELYRFDGAVKVVAPSGKS